MSTFQFHSDAVQSALSRGRTFISMHINCTTNRARFFFSDDYFFTICFDWPHEVTRIKLWPVLWSDRLHLFLQLLHFNSITPNRRKNCRVEMWIEFVCEHAVPFKRPISNGMFVFFRTFKFSTNLNQWYHLHSNDHPVFGRGQTVLYSWCRFSFVSCSFVIIRLWF